MTEQKFRELLARGYEAPGVEFKGPGMRTDKAFLAKVIRAVLGMANHRNGGSVLIGVSEDDNKPTPIGLDGDQLSTWTNYDQLSEAINEYASPSISFEMIPIEIPIEQSGRKFVHILVYEFDDIPILCRGELHDPAPSKKKSGPILRRGACYVRSRKKPETSEIPSEEEMRELLDLAIDKGVRKFVSRAIRTGLLSTHAALPSLTDEDLYKKQLEDLE